VYDINQKDTIMFFNWISDFIKGYQEPESYELLVTDEDGDKHSLVGLCSSLAKEVLALEKRIKKLEEENISTSNCLYEIENRLQAQIDNIHPVTYNLNNYGLDK
jgi:predicted  nucleic acid-binding Zn-ribbon protein